MTPSDLFTDTLTIKLLTQTTIRYLNLQSHIEPNPNILKPSHSSYLPAYEDGTDRVFRNVGI